MWHPNSQICDDGLVSTRPVLGSSALLLAGGLGLLGYSLWEAQAYSTREFTLRVLEPGRESLKILHLSDIHLMPNDHKRADWLRSLIDLKPDFIVNTGDNISHPDAVPVLLDALSDLLALPGAFVFGSNDYYGPVFKNPLSYLRKGAAPIKHAPELPWGQLRNGFNSAGWTDLNNAHEQIKVGSLLLDIVGVDDPHIHRDRYEDVAQHADTNADVSLGVVHAPYRRVLDAMTADGVDLILAGHTHGGQICLPGYGTLITNCDLDRRYAKGLSAYTLTPDDGWDVDDVDEDLVASTWLHVSPGIGTSPYAPIRLACRPEAILITLTSH